MTSAKHTPGPWTRGDLQTVTAPGYAGSTVRICSYYRRDDGFLLASAPALYAALASLLDRCEAAHDDGETCEWCEQARRALRLADGEVAQ